MMKRVLPLFFILFILSEWGCQQSGKPVPAAHTDTFIAYPAADTIVKDTLILQPDSIPIDSSGIREDSVSIH